MANESTVELKARVTAARERLAALREALNAARTEIDAAAPRIMASATAEEVGLHSVRKSEAVRLAADLRLACDDAEHNLVAAEVEHARLRRPELLNERAAAFDGLVVKLGKVLAPIRSDAAKLAEISSELDSLRVAPGTIYTPDPAFGGVTTILRRACDTAAFGGSLVRVRILRPFKPIPGGPMLDEGQTPAVAPEVAEAWIRDGLAVAA